MVGCIKPKVDLIPREEQNDVTEVRNVFTSIKEILAVNEARRPTKRNQDTN